MPILTPLCFCLFLTDTHRSTRMEKVIVIQEFQRVDVYNLSMRRGTKLWVNFNSPLQERKFNIHPITTVSLNFRYSRDARLSLYQAWRKLLLTGNLYTKYELYAPSLSFTRLHTDGAGIASPHRTIPIEKWDNKEGHSWNATAQISYRFLHKTSFSSLGVATHCFLWPLILFSRSFFLFSFSP